MNVLNTFLNPNFRYDFWQGPREAPTYEQALEGGINCVSLAHLAIEQSFGYRLPAELHCSELYLDREHFNEVDHVEDVMIGDLVWFGVERPQITVQEFTPNYNADGALLNWREFPVKHVGIIYEPDQVDPLILHATHRTGTNSLWNLSEFARHRRYKVVYGIRRLKLTA